MANRGYINFHHNYLARSFQSRYIIIAQPTQNCQQIHDVINPSLACLLFLKCPTWLIKTFDWIRWCKAVSSYGRYLNLYSATEHFDIMSLRTIFSNAFTIHYIIRQRWKCTIDIFRRKTFKLSPQKRLNLVADFEAQVMYIFFIFTSSMFD